MNEEQPSWIGFANVQLALGRTGIAAQLYDAALPHLRVQCGDLHSSTLACRMNLGVALGEEGDVVKAETHLTEVLAAYRATLTDANPDTLSAMASLGIVLERARRPEEAKAYLRDALRLRRAALGGTHPDTLSSIATLAACLGNQGELDEAEQLLVEAADGHRLIAERTGGDGTTALLSCTLNIAIMRDLREDWPGAEAAYGDALSLARQLPGKTAQTWRRTPQTGSCACCCGSASEMPLKLFSRITGASSVRRKAARMRTLLLRRSCCQSC